MEGKWSSLPTDILSMIVKLLNANRFDIIRVRAVCSWWRSSIPPSKQSPFQLSFSETSDHSNLPPFVLTQKTTLIVSPLHNDGNTLCWIIQVVETGPNKLSILNPFSSAESNSYFPKNPYLPNHINLLDYKITEINRSFRLSQFVPSSEFGHPINFKKAIVVTDDNTTDKDIKEWLKVFFLYNDGDLAFWESGMKEWVWMGNMDGVVEMIRYRDQLYAVDYHGRFMMIDMVTCKVLHCGECPRLSMWDLFQVYCMAEFNAQLYLVAYDSFYCCLSVYVLHEEEEVVWKHSCDLGGGIFYVFHDSMMCAISPKDVGLCNGNAVYIDGVSQYYGPNEVHNLSVWQHSYTPFWPPPHWIQG